MTDNAAHAAAGRRRLANAAPLGCSAFALTTFLLSLFLLRTRGVSSTNVVIAAAYGYGGLIQLLAGMWEMAAGNTVGATAFSSFGGFWISFAIIMTPGGFEIIQSLGGEDQVFYDSFGFFLMAWFIFTFLILLASLRTSIAFLSLILFLDLAFVTLGAGYFDRVDGVPHPGLITAGGVFGILASFAAWYNALAGLLTHDNSFFLVPLGTFSRAMKIEDHSIAMIS